MTNSIDLIKGKETRSDFPSKADVISFTQKMSIFLFPVLEGGVSHLSSENILRNQLKRILKPMTKRLTERSEILVDSFFKSLTSIREKLVDDAEFIAANDPAATETDEVIMAYPGFFAILVYRLANCLTVLKVPIVPRIMTEHAHSFTGVDIHPNAKIGSEFFIDHGTGIVIGETAVIGNRVKLYQGVTVGALSVDKSMATTKRHPTIEDNVIIYAGSTILGGETIIGHDSIIGGNVWLTESVPPFSLVYHQSQTTIRDRGDRKDN
jgi:serine O-acetyltransferase